MERHPRHVVCHSNPLTLARNLPTSLPTPRSSGEDAKYAVQCIHLFSQCRRHSIHSAKSNRRNSNPTFHPLTLFSSFFSPVRQTSGFWVNGEAVSVANPDPAVTLLDWLREEKGVLGIHVGCGEGGCGICTGQWSCAHWSDLPECRRTRARLARSMLMTSVRVRARVRFPKVC